MSKMLVIIDMQNGFIDQKSRFLVPIIQDLITQFVAFKLPIIFTQFVNPPKNSPYRRLLGWHKFSGSPEIDIIAELATSSATIVQKYTNTSFNSAFEKNIQLHKTNILYLCGISTESCVLKTALDAFEKNLTPIVIVDACYSTAGDKAHEAGLFTIKRNIGQDQMQKKDFLTKLLNSAVETYCERILH